MVTLQIRQIYNFDLYPVALLGSGYKNATVLAIMDAETANKDIDTVAFHINVFPLLPNGTPNSPTGYDYVKIKTSTGETTVLGLAWIKPESIELVESRTITVKIGGVNASDVLGIKNALIQNGYNKLEITVS